MPEENYNFKPTDAVRSYGQIVGHVADAQYNFCSLALGEKNPGLKIEQTKSTKADLVAALKEAVAYCDKEYDSMTDGSGSQTVKLFDTDMPKFGVLNINNMHDMEQYGDLVTYMRLKNIVPPTSEQPPAAPQKKQSKCDQAFASEAVQWSVPSSGRGIVIIPTIPPAVLPGGGKKR